MRKMIAILLSLTVLLGILAGCGEKTPATSGDAQWLNIVMTADPATLDVQKTTFE